MLFYFSQAHREHPETGWGKTEEPGWQREEQTWGVLRDGPKTRQVSSPGNSEFYSLHIFWFRFIWKQPNMMRLPEFPGSKWLNASIFRGETHPFLCWVEISWIPAACFGRPGSGCSPRPGIRCETWQTGGYPPPHMPPFVGKSKLPPAMWTGPSSAHPPAQRFSGSDAVDGDLQTSYKMILGFKNVCSDSRLGIMDSPAGLSPNCPSVRTMSRSLEQRNSGKHSGRSLNSESG